MDPVSFTLLIIAAVGLGAFIGSESHSGASVQDVHVGAAGTQDHHN